MKKELAIKRNGRLPTTRAKWNGGKQTIRHRIQKDGYKDAQGTQDNYKELSGDYNSVKKEIETINKNQEEMKNTVTEIQNTLEGITSRLDEAEDWISELEEKIKRKT